MTLTAEQKLKLVSHYVWTRVHEDPSTQVYLHEVLADLSRILNGKVDITPEVERLYTD